MKQTLICLDPIRDASLWNVIDHHLAGLRQDPTNERRPFTQLQVDAVLAAVQPGDSAGRIPEIVIHADAATVCHGRHPDTLCETIDGQPVPVTTMQRLCCDATLQAVIVNPDGTVDQLRAERRTTNRHQRRLLAAMHRTCAHPHRQVGFSQCRIHHIEWFSHGGTTLPANLLPLRETHHHLVHEGRWHLTIDDQRHVTWTRPRRHHLAHRHRTQPKPGSRNPSTRPSTASCRVSQGVEAATGVTETSCELTTRTCEHDCMSARRTEPTTARCSAVRVVRLP